MIFYKLYVDKLYGFENFSFDLTYKRESKYSPIIQRHSMFPKIKYKKIVIILGPNASGKTTLGRVFWLIQAFLSKRNIYDNNNHFTFGNIRQNQLPVVKAVFSTSKKLYEVVISLGERGLVSEKWKWVALENKPIDSLIDVLNKTDYSYDRDYSKDKISMTSSSFLNDPGHTQYIEDIGESNCFSYSFSDSCLDSGSLDQINLRVLNYILTSIDPGIENISPVKEDPKNNLITFKDGQKEILNGKGESLFSKDSILSSGTKEAIDLSYSIYTAFNGSHDTFYLDEKMSHLHSSIEEQIVRIFISLAEKRDMQIFITSHNQDLIYLELPNYNFCLLKKEKSGKISEIIQPEKIERHQDRSIKKILEDDIFSTSPSLDALNELQKILIESKSGEEII